MASGTSIGVGPGEPEQVLAFRAGSEAAFEGLFRQYQREVFGWILRIVRDGATAEDLTIETFFRIHRAHARFDPARAFGPWARRIATRVALDWLRARRPEQTMPDGFFADVASPAAADPAETAQTRRGVALALGRLPPRLRVTATLAVIED